MVSSAHHLKYYRKDNNVHNMTELDFKILAVAALLLAVILMIAEKIPLRLRVAIYVGLLIIFIVTDIIWHLAS